MTDLDPLDTSVSPRPDRAASAGAAHGPSRNANDVFSIAAERDHCSDATLSVPSRASRRLKPDTTRDIGTKPLFNWNCHPDPHR